jgi:hypothetical protein
MQKCLRAKAISARLRGALEKSDAAEAQVSSALLQCRAFCPDKDESETIFAAALGARWRGAASAQANRGTYTQN